MKVWFKELTDNISYKFFLSYLFEAVLLLLLLGFIGRLISTFDTILVAIIWAITSALLAIALAYPQIIRKKNTKEMFQDGSQVSRLINGRAFTLGICFVLAAFLSATLLVESMKWPFGIWIIVLVTVPVYFVLALLARKRVRKEYKQPYQLRGTILWSRRGAGIVLAFILTLMTIATHANDVLTFGEAFSITPLLFDDSPSAMMEELGKLSYLIDGYTTYLLSHLNFFKQPIYLLVAFILRASSAFAVTTLLSLCLLTRVDLKEVFIPIEEKHNEEMKRNVPVKLQLLC